MEAEKTINALIEKAGTAKDSGDALRFTQAACNAANALCALATAQQTERR